MCGIAGILYTDPARVVGPGTLKTIGAAIADRQQVPQPCPVRLGGGQRLVRPGHRASAQGLEGLGETAPIRRYHESVESVIGYFQSNALASDDPYLLDIIVRPEENVYPMIPAGATYKDIIMSADDLKKGVHPSRQGSNI